MNRQKLHTQLVTEHGHGTQKAAALDMALRALEESLATMTRLGHSFHLVPGPEPLEAPWPRLFYHSDGRVREVIDLQAFQELGPGWAESLALAQYLAGMAVQFEGRGGVKPVPALPAPVPGATTVTYLDKVDVHALRAANRQRRNNSEAV